MYKFVFAPCSPSQSTALRLVSTVTTRLRRPCACHEKRISPPAIRGSHHRTELTHDERMIAAVLGRQRVEPAMKESLYQVVLVPPNPAEWNLAEPGFSQCRRRGQVNNDIDVVPAAGQGLRHAIEAEIGHIRELEFDPLMIPVDAGDPNRDRKSVV